MKPILAIALFTFSLGAPAETLICKVENNSDLTKPNLANTGVAVLELDVDTQQAIFTLKDGPDIKERREPLHVDRSRLMTSEDAPINDGFAIYPSPTGEAGQILITRIGNIGKVNGLPQSESNYDKATCVSKKPRISSQLFLFNR